MSKARRQSGRLRARESRGVEMELTQTLAERVAAYALAAGAAGLGIMAGAQPAEAQIVYTPANIHFEKGALLDLNNDGIKDFRINQTWLCFSGSTCSLPPIASLRVGGVAGNGVLGSLGASRLAVGAEIGPNRSFIRGRNALMARVSAFTTTYLFGYWQSNESGFLGLQFQIDGEAHYGWAEVHIIAGGGLSPRKYRGVVKGYAYNTVPNRPIFAGQKSDGDLIGELPPRPATLGLLALGAPSLDVWRSRRWHKAEE